MKRKALTFLLTILMSMVGANAFADFDTSTKVQVGNLYYYLDTSNLLAEVTSMPSGKYTGDIVIPASFIYSNNSYSVTSIGGGAFWGCSGLTSVEIPNSVTSIGGRAFLDCSGLTSVTIPNSVTSIGDYAFSGCSGLSLIVISSGNTTYDSRGNCNAIIETASNTLITGCKNTVIPNSVTSIVDYAFSGCSGLTSVTIPNSVTSIGDYAFNGCSGLTSVEIPNSVNMGQYVFSNCTGLISATILTGLASNTFRGCTNLTSVTLGNSAAHLGEYVFKDCTSLTEVTVEREAPPGAGYDTFYGFSCSNATLYVPEGAISAYQNHTYWGQFNSIEEMQTTPPIIINFADANVKSICVSNWDTSGNGELSFDEAAAVKNLGYNKFRNKTNISSFDELQYFTGLTFIDVETFSGCSGLTSITIPNGVTTIGGSAFAWCGALTTVTIPNSVTCIQTDAFSNCSSLEKVIVPDIAAWCNISFGNISFPDHVSNPLYYAHHLYSDENTEITDLVIPNSVTSIGDYAFYLCNGLTSVTIPNSVTSIGSSAFFGCSGLTGGLTIPNSVTSISGSAFAGCSGLTSVEIPNSVTSISGSAFAGCSGLTSVEIPNSVTSIDDATFSGCSGLTSVTIPNSVTRIGIQAFSGCSGLTSVEIPNSVTSIGDYAFSGCNGGLTSIVVSSGNTEYDSRGDCNAIIETASNRLILGCNNTEIPNSVTSIGDYAFADCSSLTSVEIPNSVTSISDGAFSRCSGLTSIEIPNSVTSIGNSAFYRCSGLTSVTIPNSVTSIDGYAFYDCSGLTSVTVEIETPLTISDNVFTNRANATLYVPDGCVSAYQNAQYWQDFKFIEEIPASAPNIIDFADSNVKTICVSHWDTDGDEELSLDEAAAVTNLGTAFQNNTDITSFDELQYFTGLTSIGQGAFYNCTGLTSVTIPNSVTSIGVCAFQNCSSLTSVEIPSNVTSIGEEAFSACTALTSVEIPNSVTSIDAEAFAGCTGLTGNLVIPNSVTSIGQRAFAGCGGGLTSIVVSSGNTEYDSRGDCNAIIETASNRLILGCNNTEIPNSVTSIGEAAFRGCSGLTSVTIPNGVTSIGYFAFENCSGLNSVEIPNSVTNIEWGAFGGCTNLTSIVVSSGNTKYDSRGNCNAIIQTSTNQLISGCKNTVIPNSVTSILSYAFLDCSGLTSVVIPNSVMYINSDAFQGCSGLTSVEIPNSVTSIGNQAFFGCSSLTDVTVKIETPLTISENVFSNRANATLYVPDGCVSAYQNAQYWQDFKSIEEIIDNVSITMATGSGSPRTMIGFSSANGLDFRNVSDVKAYIAVGFTASKEVLMTRVNVVPPYTGVVLLTTNPGITVTVPTTDEDVYYANLLMPAVGPTVIYPTETIEGVEYTNLVVGKLSGTDIMGFVKDSAPKTYTNKCYLHIPSSYYNTSASAPLYDGLNMVFDDEETTGITPIDNGELMMDNVYYDLNGRRVEHPTKGLYIVNGKKVIVK